eukprot:GHVU01148813.1.p1 GENE.GHVU01148813.1~~GHVU01148813.1.p1  ORF type:complete len:389 (+),score=96.02 GHVU01148813.1:850-2016(+)
MGVVTSISGVCGMTEYIFRALPAALMAPRPRVVSVPVGPSAQPDKEQQKEKEKEKEEPRQNTCTDSAAPPAGEACDGPETAATAVSLRGAAADVPVAAVGVAEGDKDKGPVAEAEAAAAETTTADKDQQEAAKEEGEEEGAANAAAAAAAGAGAGAAGGGNGPVVASSEVGEGMGASDGECRQHTVYRVYAHKVFCEARETASHLLRSGGLFGYWRPLYRPKSTEWKGSDDSSNRGASDADSDTDKNEDRERGEETAAGTETTTAATPVGARFDGRCCPFFDPIDPPEAADNNSRGDSRGTEGRQTTPLQSVSAAAAARRLSGSVLRVLQPLALVLPAALPGRFRYPCVHPYSNEEFSMEIECSHGPIDITDEDMKAVKVGAYDVYLR